MATSETAAMLGSAYRKSRARLPTIESQDYDVEDTAVLSIDDVMNTPPTEYNSDGDTANDISSIQQQLTKWLTNYDTNVTQEQFTDLLQKIVPFVNQTQIEQLFNSIDYTQSGVINKQVLLQNNYLANLTMRFYANKAVLEQEDDQKAPPAMVLSPSGSSFQTYGDIAVEMENEKLRKENETLRNWINEVGKPLEARAKKLEDTIQVYQDENQEVTLEIEQLRSEQRGILNLQSQLKTLSNTTSFMSKENEELKRLQLENKKSLQIEHRKLRDAKKKIKNLEQLNKELMTINDQYRKRNEELTESKEIDAENLQNMRSALVEQQLQIQQLLNERNEALNTAQEEVEALNLEIAEKEAKLVNVEEATDAKPERIAHGIQHTLQYSALPANLWSEFGAMGGMGGISTDLYGSGAGAHGLMSSPTATLRLTQRLSSLQQPVPKSLNLNGQQSLKMSSPPEIFPDAVVDVGSSPEMQPMQTPEPSNFNPNFNPNAVNPPSTMQSYASVASVDGDGDSLVEVNYVNYNAMQRLDLKDKNSILSNNGLIFMEDENGTHNVHGSSNQEMYQFMDESIRKEIELETRQAVKKEFEKNFEIQAQQIRVDAHMERQKENEKYNQQITQLQDCLMRYEKEKKQMKITHETQLMKYRIEMKDMKKELKRLKNDKSSQQKKERVKRVHKTDNEAHEGTQVCALPSWKSLWKRTQSKERLLSDDD